MRRVLFICGRNKRRSPTAEEIFRSIPGIEVASAGISSDSPTPVDPDLIEWADIIFVMEKSHRIKLAERFGASVQAKSVICLEIPDEYQYMDPRLVNRLTVAVSSHLGLSRE